MKKITVFLLMTAIILTCCSLHSCQDGADSFLYKYDGDKLEKIMDLPAGDKLDFAIEMTSDGTYYGYETGMETPNYRSVFNEGTDAEAAYDLIVDFENETIAYISPDLAGTGIRRVYVSFTTTLEFYDFLP